MPQEFTDIPWGGPAAAQGSAYSKRYLVWHATSNNAAPANECAYARTRTDGVGLHICADANTVMQALETTYGTGHVGSTVGNHYGISFEMVGVNADSEAHWKAVIDRAAYAVREICAKWRIPHRWLTAAQLNDGVSKGWCTHNDARLAWGHTTHDDPGPNFPRQYAIDRVNGSIEGAAVADSYNSVSEQGRVDALYNDLPLATVGYSLDKNQPNALHTRLVRMEEKLDQLLARPAASVTAGQLADLTEALQQGLSGTVSAAVKAELTKTHLAVND